MKNTFQKEKPLEKTEKKLKNSWENCEIQWNELQVGTEIEYRKVIKFKCWFVTSGGR